MFFGPISVYACNADFLITYILKFSSNLGQMQNFKLKYTIKGKKKSDLYFVFKF